MSIAHHQETDSHSLLEAIRGRIAEHLYSAYNDAESLLGNLDRWTQQRITDENLAKVALVLSADDPGEACYRDLVREIDTEAESGIYLTGQSTTLEHLRNLADESGVSGQLHRDMDTIAPLLFPDEAERSRHDLDLVWITVQSRHDRAHLDATVSEIVMCFLMNDAESVRDMTNVMRSLTYTYHEDDVRRRETDGDRDQPSADGACREDGRDAQACDRVARATLQKRLRRRGIRCARRSFV